MKEFGDVQGTLLDLLGSSLFSRPYTPSPEVDFEAVLRESELQSVTLIAFRDVASLPLSEDVAVRIRQRLKEHMMGTVQCFRNHGYLHALMEKNGIPYCIIKGAASAQYYADPLSRNMGDVDFYVPTEHLQKARAVLLEDGFEEQEQAHGYHASFFKKGTHLELHFAPIAAPDGELGALFYEYWDGICDRSVLCEGGIVRFRMTDPFLHGFILLSHLQSHLLSEGVGLRHVCDWLVFTERFSDEEFLSLFRDRLKRVGLWRLACLLCLAASEYLGMPYREWMGEDRQTARALFEDILRGGNFGSKDRRRLYEGYFISDNRRTSVKRNRILQAFSSVNDLVDRYWSLPKRFPILYPFGWIYFSLRFFFRRLTGKRKVSVRSAYSESKKRKELYESLRLLTPED